ncbi:MAG: FecR domain-containing protein [Phycisphaerae bacterium]|nr:FecR domain-containing protein [Phycisphaerae bacterium]
MSTSAPFPDIDELLQLLLDGRIEPDELEPLEKAILQDPKVRDYYINSLLVRAVIRRSVRAAGELSPSDLIRSLSGPKASPRGLKRFVRHLYSVAAIVVLGVMILSVWVLFHRGPQGPVVGKLAGEYQAQWAGSHPRWGDSLHAGSYHLRAGLAKVDLDRGTTVLLEAPCRIELEGANEMVLTSGKLTALVPPQAQGFQVRTPTVVVTDLGTEFGVIAHADGSTEAHVLKGRISMTLDSTRSGQTAPFVVNEGLAAVVDASGQTIRGGLVAQPDSFLLRLPPASQIDLADIVGGGNGHGSGTLAQGIDLKTGEVFRGPATSWAISNQSKFRPLPQFRGIDGVFVPNGARGPVVISSTGLTFAQCPATNGIFFGGPANSGKVYATQTRRVYTARLNAIDYGNASHPALHLHPNAGITFDLDQLRADNPEARIERFTAVCGIPKDIPFTRTSPADVWVLLDGAVRLHLQFPADRNTTETVEVMIGPQTRFLTLAVTCPGNPGFCWVFFGDPFLE